MRDRLWEAAGVLRDRLDARGVRDLLLTLLAVRHLGARPEAPPEARWSAVVASTDGPARAVRALIAAQPALSRAFPPLPEVGPERLSGVLDALGALPAEADADVVGEAFMHLLGDLARAEGRRGGQYYTPPSIARLLLALVEDVDGATVYDPCCGTGGLLIAAGQAGAARLTGQELNPATWGLAHLAAAVHGLTLDLADGPADTLRADRHPTLRADRVVANPPFNVSGWGAASVADDPRFARGLPPDGDANLAWVQHILHHLAPGGRAAVILSNGSLTGRGADLRAALVAEGVVEAVVALPDLLFLTTPIPACVWVLTAGPPVDDVLFVDARPLGRRVTRAWRILDDPDLDTIVAPLARARSGEPVDTPGLARTLPRAEVGGDLVPGRWVGAAPVRADDDLAELLGAWTEADAEARALDEALHAALGSLQEHG